LCGELPRVLAQRIDAADIEALELGERQRVDGRARRGKPAAVGSTHDVGVEHGIVREHEHAILCDSEIGLERRDADLERLGEGGQRILRRQTAGAPVALQIEGIHRRSRDHQGDKSGRKYSRLSHERRRPRIVVVGRA
jgi:hypothetical protein